MSMTGSNSNSDCPVDMALSLPAGKWKSLLRRRLSSGTSRTELQRFAEGGRQRILALQIGELKRVSMLVRKAFAEVPPRVEYSPTMSARAAVAVLEAIGERFGPPRAERLALSVTSIAGRLASAASATTARLPAPSQGGLPR